MKIASSRDFGLGFKGHLTEKKTWFYYVLLGNGSSNKAETNKGKRVYGSLAFKPTKSITLEVYGDYEHSSDNKRYYVYQGFAAYQTNRGRVAVMYARRHFKQELESQAVKENDYDIFSAFTVITPAKNVELIARYDRMFGSGFEQNFSGHKISYIPFADNPGAAFNHIVLALSWQGAKNMWLIPNIKYTFYGHPRQGEKPDQDVYTNMTIFFKF